MIILDTQPVSQLQRRVIGRCSNRTMDQRLFRPGRLDHGRHAFRAVQRVYCGDQRRQRAREAVVAICVFAETHRALQSPMERANPIFRRRRGEGVSEVFAAIGTKDRRPRCTYRRYRACP